MKFWLLVGLFLLVVWLVRGGLRRVKPPPQPPDSPAPPTPPDSEHEEIVACVQCGIHLPRSEAVAAPAGWFCGHPHRIAHEDAASH